MDIDSNSKFDMPSFDDPHLSSLIRDLHDNHSIEKVAGLLWIDKDCSWWILVDGKKEDVKIDIMNCYHEDGSGIGEFLRRLCLEPVLRSRSHFSEANDTESSQSLTGLWLILWFAIHVASERAFIGSLAAGQAFKQKWFKKPIRSGHSEGEEGSNIYDTLKNLNLEKQPISIILNKLSDRIY